MILSGGLAQLFLSIAQWNWVCCLPNSIWMQLQCGCSLTEQLFSRLCPGTRPSFAPNLSRSESESAYGSTLPIVLRQKATASGEDCSCWRVSGSRVSAVLPKAPQFWTPALARPLSDWSSRSLKFPLAQYVVHYVVQSMYPTMHCSK